MSTTVAIEHVLMDEVIQGPGHPAEDADGSFEHGGLTGPFMAEHGRYLSEVFAGTGGLLLGRVTYDIWARYWPAVTDETDVMAQALNGRPKYVASATLENPGWAGTTVIRDVTAEAAKLREQPGRPLLVMGSSVATHTLTEHGLTISTSSGSTRWCSAAGRGCSPAAARRSPCRLVSSMTTAGGLAILSCEP